MSEIQVKTDQNRKTFTGKRVFDFRHIISRIFHKKYPFTVETSIHGIIMFTIAFKLSVKTKIASLSLQIILQPAKKLSYPNRSLISGGLNQDYAAIIYKFNIQLSILN